MPCFKHSGIFLFIYLSFWGKGACKQKQSHNLVPVTVLGVDLFLCVLIINYKNQLLHHSGYQSFLVKLRVIGLVLKLIACEFHCLWIYRVFMCQLSFYINLTQQFVLSLIHLQGYIIKFLAVIFKLMIVAFFYLSSYIIYYIFWIFYQIVISGKPVHNVHSGTLDLGSNNSDKSDAVSYGSFAVQCSS